MSGIESIVTRLDNFGVVDFLIPMMLIYIVTYKTLELFEKKNALGLQSIADEKTRVIISLVFSFVGGTMELAPGLTLGKLIKILFPGLAFFAILILVTHIYFAYLGINFVDYLLTNKPLQLFIFAALIIGNIFYILSAFNYQFSPFSAGFLTLFLDPSIVIIALFTLLLYFITPKNPNAPKTKKKPSTPKKSKEAPKKDSSTASQPTQDNTKKPDKQPDQNQNSPPKEDTPKDDQAPPSQNAQPFDDNENVMGYHPEAGKVKFQKKKK